MQHHHKAYKSRNSIGRKSEMAKPKLPTEEKRKRKLARQLDKLFPGWKFHLLNGKTISIYQHFFSPKKKAV